MSILARPASGATPAILTIGHITRDVREDGSFTLGGTVTFAAVTAYRLGLAAAIATRADERLLADLPARLPGVGLAARVSSHTTTFANLYHDGFRVQYLRARADSMRADDVPREWRDAPVVLLGPLAQELDSSILHSFPKTRGSLIAATPQGWLRRWDADGRVWPTPWRNADAILSHLDALILSYDDLQPFANGKRADAETMLTQWSARVPLLVATDGRHGAVLFQGESRETFPAFASTELDPTGAGDVFAAAFLCRLHECGDPREAVVFANCAASFSVEQVGISGIPTRAMVEERLQGRASFDTRAL